MSRPNIVLIMTDQHRRDTLGCYGARVCRTPALDRLAASGTRFDAAFTPSAICTPTRASLVTGVAPFRHKLLANFERNVGYREELGDEFAPFSALLAGWGYDCHHVGKWHVGRKRGPADFGFTGEHFVGWGNPVDHPAYLRYLHERGLPGYQLRREIRGVFPNGEPGNLLAGILDGPTESTFEHFLADLAIEQILAAAHTGRPFFLALHVFGPHLPYCLPAEWYHRYDAEDVVLPASMAETFAGKPMVQRHYSQHWAVDSLGEKTWRELTAAYWGYVSMIDAEIGRVLDRLDEVSDDSAVFFSADHGEFTGAHRLHDKGPAMYDDIYRIPMLARIPGGPAGNVAQGITTITDLTATFADLAGAGVPDHYDGRSLVPLLRGEHPADWRPDFVGEFHGHHFPYPQRMLRTSHHKLIINPADVNELYDLELDPDELRNVYESPAYQEIRLDLTRRLYAALRERGDNFYHWMTSMLDVGGKSYDAALSSLDPDRSHRPAPEERSQP